MTRLVSLLSPLLLCGVLLTVLASPSRGSLAGLGTVISVLAAPNATLPLELMETDPSASADPSATRRNHTDLLHHHQPTTDPNDSGDYSSSSYLSDARDHASPAVSFRLPVQRRAAAAAATAAAAITATRTSPANRINATSTSKPCYNKTSGTLHVTQTGAQAPLAPLRPSMPSSSLMSGGVVLLLGLLVLTSLAGLCAPDARPQPAGRQKTACAPRLPSGFDLVMEQHLTSSLSSEVEQTMRLRRRCSESILQQRPSAFDLQLDSVLGVSGLVDALMDSDESNGILLPAAPAQETSALAQ